MSKRSKSNNKTIVTLLMFIVLVLIVLAALFNTDILINQERQVSVNSAKINSNKDSVTQSSEKDPYENMARSKLSGQWVEKELAEKVPYAVMYSNIADAMPQANISKADVVFEAPVEGKITRMCCLFENQTDLEKIGPVRSCRTYFLLFAREFESIYVHFGYSEYAEKYLKNDSFKSLDGMSYCNFYRTNDRVAPHNAYTSWAGIADSVQAKNYSSVYSQGYTSPFTFHTQENPIVPPSGTTCDRVDMNYSYNQPYFEYDAAKNRYLRYQFGAAQIDQQTGEQLEFDNIIVKYVEPDYYENGTPNYKISGVGEGYFITQGYGQKITWVKENESYGATKYYYEDGTEIILNPGKTYVALVETSQKITVQ